MLQKIGSIVRMLGGLVALGAGLASVSSAAGVDFLREVKPILVARCFKCHSSLAQENNLRLDSIAAIQKGGDGGSAVVPGKSAESKLILAVRGQGDLKMPPEGDRLTDPQIALLARWIDEGAHGPPAGAETKVEHWSYQRPRRPLVPMPRNAAFAQNPVDAFVAARHEDLKLTPVPEAPRALLLRRLYLDLIGLPPTPMELADFLADASPGAYEKVVNRLLDSPHYGERWGRHWMDVWRYSDWDGFGAEIRESQPHIWHWRDWIVESLNADKPYDQMIVEMLAGDELAPQDPATLRATGFLVRNWYKFNRNAWLDNSVEHTGKAFLATTFNCARCHDHMYDPIKQQEYYQLRACFEPHDVRTDRVPGQPDIAKDGIARVYDAKAAEPTFLFVRGNEKDPVKENPLAPQVPQLLRDVGFKLEPVTLPAAVYYPGLQPNIQAESLAAAGAEIDKARVALAASRSNFAAARQKLTDRLATASQPAPMLEAKVEPFLVDDFSKQRDDVWKLGAGQWEYAGAKLLQKEARDSLLGISTLKPPPKDFVARFRFKTTGGNTWKSVGMSFDALDDKHLNTVYVSAFAGGSKVQASFRRDGQDHYPPEAAKPQPVELNREYELEVIVRDMLVNVSLNGQFALAYRYPSRNTEGKLLLWAFDATAEFLSFRLEPLAATVALMEVGGAPAAPPTMEPAALVVLVEDAEKAALVAQKKMEAAELARQSLVARINADKAQYAVPPAANVKELALAAGKSEREMALLSAAISVLEGELKLAQAKRAVKAGDMATQKAAADAETAFQSLVKNREAAQAAVSQPNEAYAKLTPVYPSTSTGRRLALARFIAAKENPLTARVAINHLWLRHFGSPLVPTVFDFGLNGKPPTNPALLDWLAVELMDRGWSMKQIHRLIVTSATYKMQSTLAVKGDGVGGDKAASQALLAANVAIDPENRGYWRQNPRRMEAELVRDATLYVAGSLDTTLGGPDLDQNAGLTANRRSLYFRSAKEKKMQFLALFDSPNPVECYRRGESIAPQQALAMANSSLTLSQARILARKLAEQIGISSPSAADLSTKELSPRFVREAFMCVLCREPAADEQAACIEFLAQQALRLTDLKTLSPFTAGPAAQIAPSADPQQRARENLVHVLLNHNDFVTVR